MDSMNERLKKARISAGYSSATKAAHALGIEYPTYAAHENGNRSIQRDAAIFYAKRFRTNLEWLLTGKGAQRSAWRTVQVHGYVQAGEWHEAKEWELDDKYEVVVPDLTELSKFNLYGVEVRGPSMDKRYAPGSVVVFTDVIETQENLEVGKRYVVQRENADGTFEMTVKTLWQDAEGARWLIPESTDPRFQESIRITGNEGDTVRVIGRVRYVVGIE